MNCALIATRSKPPAKGQVVANGKMWKQTTFLKYVTNSTPMRGGEDAAISIGQHRPVDDNPPSLRADQTGNRIDNRGLTRSRAAKKGCEPAPTAEMDVELEGAEPMLDIDFEHGVKLRKGYGSCLDPGSRWPTST